LQSDDFDSITKSAKFSTKFSALYDVTVSHMHDSCCILVTIPEAQEDMNTKIDKNTSASQQ
jgi:hypothetical protein